MPNQHEVTDVNALGIMWVALISTIASIVMFLGLYAAFSSLKSSVISHTTTMAPLDLIKERKGPPPPLLEINPKPHNTLLRAQEQQLLLSYEWLDRQQKVVRVPIDKAIEILATH